MPVLEYFVSFAIFHPLKPSYLVQAMRSPLFLAVCPDDVILGIVLFWTFFNFLNYKSDVRPMAMFHLWATLVFMYCLATSSSFSLCEIPNVCFTICAMWTWPVAFRSDVLKIMIL